MKLKKSLFLCCLAFTAIFSIGCNAKVRVDNSLQEKYGPDADYFMGLKAVQEKNSKQALHHFNKASKNGSKYVRRRSLEQKIKLGNIQQQIAGLKEYLALYNDDAALLFGCKIYFENQEYAKLLEATNAIDISKCPNELAKMRIIAMHEKQDSRLDNTTCLWFVTRKISPDHISFYSEHLSKILNLSDFELITPVDENSTSAENETSKSGQNFSDAFACITKFRMLCAEKNFSSAFQIIDNVKEICSEQKLIPFTSQLIADMGRTYYHASRRYSENANYFLDLSNSSFGRDPSFKYLSLIYAGQIFDKSGVYYTKAEEAFVAAMNCAPTDEDYDMALWFLLNSKLSISTDKCVEALEKYCSVWKNPYYFSDILDDLSLLLFTGANWDSFPKLYKILDGHADNVSTAKFAYLTGKLIDQKLLKGTDEEKTEAFTKAFELNGGTDIYYRLLAAKELSIEPEEIERKVFSSTTALSATNDAEAEKLLMGYADFGFEDLIYPEWQYFYTLDSKIFGLETICQVADFLHSCGTPANNNYYKSLHMISKTANLDNSKVSKKVFELSYPKNFSKEIKAAAEEFEVEEYDMLGLIRTESFFNPIVESHAGALGLSQLMETTFEENARKLKIQNPDITDPQTNIRVGTFYYSDLVRRLDGSDILALFAYNAGITRVRRWLQSSRVGLGMFKNLPSELFLETIPISETRNYGRKVIQSSAIYAWLYYDKNPCDIIDEMM